MKSPDSYRRTCLYKMTVINYHFIDIQYGLFYKQVCMFRKFFEKRLFIYNKLVILIEAKEVF